MLPIFIAEIYGTALLILLGNGVVAGAILGKTKSNGAGWIAITAGWGFAVTIGVYTAGWISGGHLNPAVSFAQVLVGGIGVSDWFVYASGQIIGAMIGATLVFILYYHHFAATDDGETKRACFCTAPAIYSPFFNFFSEVIGTTVLVFAALVLGITANAIPPYFGPFIIGIVVFSIGLSLGGLTGYAINPARDLGPRIVHALLPIPGKTHSDWKYSWVPVFGPLVGAAVAAFLFTSLFMPFFMAS